MLDLTPHPVYCYQIKNSEFREFPSIYRACMDLFGSHNHSYHKGILQSIDSDNKRKRSAYGWVWFSKKDNASIVPTNELFLAMNYRHQTMHQKGRVNWAVLEKAHANHRTPVIAFNDNGEEIYYNSLVEAADDFGTSKSNICRVVRNINKGNTSHHLGQKRLKACGWYFRYA